MTALAHGVDIVPVERIASMLEEHGERFLSRIFTEQERSYADANPKRRIEHLAARFAAKEAVMKALGTGWGEGVGWKDIEVQRAVSGAPSVALHGKAAAVAAGRGLGEWRLSLSHGGGFAIASVVAMGG